MNGLAKFGEASTGLSKLLRQFLPRRYLVGAGNFEIPTSSLKVSHSASELRPQTKYYARYLHEFW